MKDISETRLSLPKKMADPNRAEKNRNLPKGKREPGQRARSVPHKQPYVRAVFLSAMHYMGILALLTTLVIFFVNPTHLATRVFILSVVFLGFTWMLAFFKRRSTYCPLCKGTPLINTGALTHPKAARIWPFNHGVSAILSIIATQKFRCMYCGTSYDLMKIPAHILERDEWKQRTEYTPDDPD